MNSHA